MKFKPFVSILPVSPIDNVSSNNISLFKNYKDAEKASLQTTHRVSISDSSRPRVHRA